MIYLVIFIVFLIPVIRFDLMKIVGGEKVWVYLEWLILVLVAGLRYRVGGDTLIYMIFFEDYPALSELSDFDFESAQYNPLWYIYNSIFKSLGNSFTLFQLFQAMLVNLAFFRFFKRYCPACFFSAVLVYFWGYYCYFNMEILREILCISILLEAYPFLEKKRFLPYYLLCGLALCIHMSAAIMFVLPLAMLVRRDRFWLAALIVVAMVVLLKIIDVVSLLLFMTFEGKTAETIRTYMTLQTPNFIGATVQFLIAVPFMILMFVRNRFGYRNNDLMGALLLFVVAIQASAMFVPMVPRFSNYFMAFGIVFVLNTFYENYWDIRSHLLARVLVTVALLIYGFNLSYFYLKNKNDDLRGSHVYNRYIPYYSVFEMKEDKTREMLLQNERANVGYY